MLYNKIIICKGGFYEFCPKSAIMHFGRSQGAMDRGLFLVYPKGIRNICAEF